MSELQAIAGCSKACLAEGIERCVNGWPDGSCGARPQGTQWPKNARAQQEPQWKNTEVVRHGSVAYEFDLGGDDKPEVTYLDDGLMPDYSRTVFYLYELKGAHRGEPIKVKMVNPNFEYDGGGAAYVWDKLLYADNDAHVEDVIDDFYSEALHDDLRDLINETWD